ncbi:MAG: putative transport system permease protein, partial [Actinomycetota bacterium]|nr:putative transport system permease protein [Actinomycetota bacterium]
TGSIYPAFVNLQDSFDLGIFGSADGNIGHTVQAGRLLSGRMPRQDRADEVVLNPQAAQQLHAHTGGVVRLGTITPEQIAHLDETFSGKLEGPALRLHVTGVVREADDLLGDKASALLIATQAFERTYHDRIGRYAAFGSYRLKEGASFASFAEKARPLLGTQGNASLVSATSDLSAGVHDSLRFLAVGLLLVAAAALLVGLIAGAQALARQLGLATPDQPSLAALGLTRYERATAVLMVALPVAVVAGIVAIVGAVLASPLTPINLGRQAEPDPGMAFDPLVHVSGAVATAVLVLVGAATAGWIVAGRTSGPSSTGRSRPSMGSRVARSLRLGAGGTTGVRMALESGTGRSAVPVRSALVAAIVGVAGVTGALTFGSSLDRLGATPARYGKPWDLMPDATASEAPKMAANPAVGQFGVLMHAGVVLRGEGLTGYAMRPLKGSPGYSLVRGRPPADDGEVALGRDVLERYGLRVGSVVQFATAAKGPRTFHVVGVFLGPSQDQDGIAAGALFSPKALEAVAHSDVVQQAVLVWRDGVDPTAALHRFEKLFPTRVSAYAIPRQPGEVVNLLRVRSLPSVVGGILAVVGAAALLHALATSARRRRQDLAVLRAIGFVRAQVAGAVTTQATTIAVVGVLAGIPLGVALGRWAWIFTADSVGVATDPFVPLVSGALVIGAALVVANVLGAPVGLRVSRLRPAVALRAE